VLAQRAASEGPRWTRAMGDQSAPIPEKVTSELGRIIRKEEGRSMRAVKDSLAAPLRAKWGKSDDLRWMRTGKGSWATPF